jgi:hypothetical protein
LSLFLEEAYCTTAVCLFFTKIKKEEKPMEHLELIRIEQTTGALEGG